MSRALRIFLTLGVTLTTLSAGAGQISHARAATKQILTVTIANPYVDPAQYLNAKTKKNDPADYQLAQFTQSIFNLFYKMHPDYVIQPLNWGWSDPLRQKILLKIAAGNAPDVIVGEDFIPEFARLGILAPIPTGTLRQDLAAGPLSGGTYNGAIYAIPAETGIFELYYNKALFRRAGLNPTSPPRTWAQWLADSRKIAALGHGISGTTIQGNTGLGAAFRVAPFLRQLGGDFATQDGAKILFNSPANIKAFTFLRQLAATAATGVTSIVDEGKFFGSTWWAGKAGFVVDGPWEIDSSIQNKLDFGVAALPLPAGGHAANVVVGNQMFGATKLSRHRQAALDFVRLLATRQAAMMNYVATGRLPANLQVLDYVRTHASQAMTIFVQGITGANITPLPVYAANPQKIWDTWYNAQLAALATNQPIPQVLATAQSNAEALLQQ